MARPPARLPTRPPARPQAEPGLTGVSPQDGHALPPGLADGTDMTPFTMRSDSTRTRDTATPMRLVNVRHPVCHPVRWREARLPLGWDLRGPAPSAAPAAVSGHLLCVTSPGLLTSSPELYSLGPTSPIPRPHPPTPRPVTAVRCVFLSLVCLDPTYKRDHAVFVLLCLTHFTSHNVPKGHPCCHSWYDRSQCLKRRPQQPPVLKPTQAHPPALPVTAWAPPGAPGRPVMTRLPYHGDVHDRKPLPAGRWREVCPAAGSPRRPEPAKPKRCPVSPPGPTGSDTDSPH